MGAPTLLIMAAGLGQRYGGGKQIDRVGPSGQLLLEYSIFDAHRAGFGAVVFVIRRELIDEFTSLARRLPADLDLHLVYQETAALPPWFSPPARTRPWGTTHAVLAARDVLDAPFTVVNADDFYGARAFELAAAACGDVEGKKAGALIGFRLDATLSEHGPVARAIPVLDGHNVTWIDEVRGIERTAGGIVGTFPDGIRTLTGGEIVSMNCWAFPAETLAGLERAFEEFLRDRGLDPAAESPLPEAVNQLLQIKQLRMTVVEAPGPWFGLTYRADRARVATGLRALTEFGAYPVDLWS